MGKKVKCPSCGAKNDAGRHRCRVCTTIIDASAAEGLPKGVAKQRKLDDQLAIAAERNQRPFEAGELHEDVAAAGGPRLPAAGAPVEGPSYGVAPAVPAAPAPPPPPPPPPASMPEPPVVNEPPLVTEPVAEVELPADAIVIAAAPRQVPNAVPEAPDAPTEPWDAVGGIEIDVVSRNASAAPPPLEYDGDWDPDGLVIDPPR